MRYEIVKKYILLSSLVDFRINKILNKLEGKGKPKVYFRIVPESEVSERYRAQAEKILRVSNWTLKLQGVRINWIEYVFCSGEKPEDSQEIIEHVGPDYGWADIEKNEVFIRYDMPLKDVGFVLAHELHHLWFNKKYGAEYSYEEDRYIYERTANDFARKILLQIWELDRYEKPLFFPAGEPRHRN